MVRLYRACDCYSKYCKHNPAINNIKPKDIVKATDNGYPLRCGSGIYDSAVVVSVKPLVMLSKHSDMKWSCYEGPLETIGKVSTFTMWRMRFRRWRNERSRS